MSIRTNYIENGIENSVGDITKFGDITGVETKNLGIRPDGMPIEPQIQGTGTLYSDDIMNTYGVVPNKDLSDVDYRNKLAMESYYNNDYDYYTEGDDSGPDLKKMDKEIEKAFKDTGSSGSNTPVKFDDKALGKLESSGLEHIMEDTCYALGASDYDMRVMCRLEAFINEEAKAKYTNTLNRLASLDESGVYLQEAAKKVAKNVANVKKKMIKGYLKAKKAARFKNVKSECDGSYNSNQSMPKIEGADLAHIMEDTCYALDLSDYDKQVLSRLEACINEEAINKYSDALHRVAEMDYKGDCLHEAANIVANDIVNVKEKMFKSYFRSRI